MTGTDAAFVPWKNKPASLLLMECPMNVWKQQLQRNKNALVGNVQCCITRCCNNSHSTCSIVPAGMHYESAGRKVQAAGSSRGSHAEGAQVPPTTEGRRHLINLQHSPFY